MSSFQFTCIKSKQSRPHLNFTSACLKGKNTFTPIFYEEFRQLNFYRKINKILTWMIHNR